MEKQMIAIQEKEIELMGEQIKNHKENRNTLNNLISLQKKEIEELKGKSSSLKDFISDRLSECNDQDSILIFKEELELMLHKMSNEKIQNLLINKNNYETI